MERATIFGFRMHDEQELTSFHEAGHILVAYERWGRELAVMLRTSGDDLGHAYFRLRSFVVNDHVRVALAGATAEWLFSGRWSWTAADLDLAAIAEWRAQYATFVGIDEALRELAYCVEDVARTLTSNWSAVQALASTLRAESV